MCICSVLGTVFSRWMCFLIFFSQQPYGMGTIYNKKPRGQRGLGETSEVTSCSSYSLECSGASVLWLGHSLSLHWPLLWLQDAHEGLTPGTHAISLCRTFPSVSTFLWFQEPPVDVPSEFLDHVPLVPLYPLSCFPAPSLRRCLPSLSLRSVPPSVTCYAWGVQSSVGSIP